MASQRITCLNKVKAMLDGITSFDFAVRFIRKRIQYVTSVYRRYQFSESFEGKLIEMERGDREKGRVENMRETINK